MQQDGATLVFDLVAIESPLEHGSQQLDASLPINKLLDDIALLLVEERALLPNVDGALELHLGVHKQSLPDNVHAVRL